MVDTSDKSRFTRTGRPADDNNLSLGNRELNILEDMELIEPFVQAGNFNGRVGR